MGAAGTLPAAPVGVVGRAAQQLRLRELTDAARAGHGGAVVLRGAVGLGKSRLLGWLAESSPDMRVLRMTGVTAESGFAFAGLHELLQPVLATLSMLPARQAEALRRAWEPVRGEPVDHFAVSAATLGLLCTLADGGPVLVVVDGLHLIDQASVDALLFAARRVSGDRVAIVLATDDRTGWHPDLAGLPEVALEPLDRPACHDLLAAQPLALVPSVARALVDAAQGNPLVLTETPAQLDDAQRSGNAPLPDPLPAGARIVRIFEPRLLGLPPETRRSLLLAAAEEGGELAVLLRAEGFDLSSLDAAERAGLVVTTGDRVLFRHPLVRVAVHGAATGGERRAAHAALADAVPGDALDRRALHLARAAAGPDEGVAGTLEEAGRRERLRCRVSQSGLLEQAARLSSSPDERARRLLAAGTAADLGGDGERAAVLLDAGLEVVTDKAVHADLVLARFGVGRARGDDVRRLDLAGCAEDLAGADPVRAARLTSALWRAALDRLDRVAARRLAARSLSLVGLASGDDLARLLAVRAWHDALDGATATARRSALAAGEAQHRHPTADLADVATSLVWSEEYAAAAALVEPALARDREAGALRELIADLWTWGLLELRRGRLPQAAAAAYEAQELALENGQRDRELWCATLVAEVCAVSGRFDECRALGDLVRRDAGALGLHICVAVAEHAEGRAALASGDVDRAAALLGRAEAALGGALDTVTGHRAELVEALARGGSAASAEVLARRLGDAALEARPGGWLEHLARRAAALTTGDAASVEAVVATAGDGVSPLEVARTRLLAAQRLRREGQRRRAAAELAEVRAVAERWGAGALRVECDRESAGGPGGAGGVGGPGAAAGAGGRGGGQVESLTAREARVALLAADGATNREIAAALFLSPKTVELHLSHVYRKLGLRSRTELARRLPR